MKRWRIDGEPSDEILHDLAEIILKGGVALLPTDTVYGLHAAASRPDGAMRIAELKGRDEAKRFVVIAASAQQLRDFGVEIPSGLEQIWPAPLTAILHRGAESMAVRVPSVDWLRRLLEQTGPLISTSANRSGEPVITSPAELAREIDRRLDAVVDAGPRMAKASTIVDFTSTVPKVIRKGDTDFTQDLWKTLRISL